jgi:hypothetical protein
MESLYPNLDSELSRRNLNYRDLAPVVGVSEMQMYRRLRGQTNWRLDEAVKVWWFLDSPDVSSLFARR